MWITTNCGILFHWEYQTTLPVFCETCMQVKKQQLELDMEQWTVSKLGKEYIKAVYCHPAYYLICNIMQNAGLDEAQAGIKISGRNINIIRYADDTTSTAENEELKSLLMKVKEESEKDALKLNVQKTKIIQSHRFVENGWGKMETVTDYIFLGSKITVDVD